MNPEGKTLFQEETDKYQDAEGRTKKTRVQQGLTLAGTSLVLSICFWLLLLILDFKVSPLIGWAIPVIFIGLAGAFLYGLIKAVRDAVRSTREVICPKCSMANKIYPDVKKYICPQCRTLMLLGEDREEMPQMATCLYCGLQTAVASNHGQFICPNCGLVRESMSSDITLISQPCRFCSQVIPDGSIYCKYCGSVFKTDFTQPLHNNPAFAYDQDWKAGKDAAGHFYFAKAILKGIGDKSASLKTLTHVQAGLSSLADALKSLEEAWLDSSLHSDIGTLLPEIDRTYGALLERELALIKTIPASTAFSKGSLDTIAKEPQITARRRLETRLGDAVDSSGSIGRWDEKLVIIEVKEKTCGLKNYEKLIGESRRFQEWIQQRMERPSKSFCSQCGWALKPGQKFCNNCGVKL